MAITRVPLSGALRVGPLDRDARDGSARAWCARLLRVLTTVQQQTTATVDDSAGVGTVLASVVVLLVPVSWLVSTNLVLYTWHGDYRIK